MSTDYPADQMVTWQAGIPSPDKRNGLELANNTVRSRISAPTDTKELLKLRAIDLFTCRPPSTPGPRPRNEPPQLMLTRSWLQTAAGLIAKHSPEHAIPQYLYSRPAGPQALPESRDPAGPSPRRKCRRFDIKPNIKCCGGEFCRFRRLVCA